MLGVGGGMAVAVTAGLSSWNLGRAAGGAVRGLRRIWCRAVVVGWWGLSPWVWSWPAAGLARALCVL